MIGESKLGQALAPLCVLLLLASACTSSSSEAGEPDGPAVTTAVVTGAPDTVETGGPVELLPSINAGPDRLVWVHHREPADLHLDDPSNGTEIAAWIRQGLLEGLFGIDRTISYYPELLAKEPTVAADGSGTVRVEYELRPDLVWSDGEPLTSADVAYTHRILVEGCEVESDGSIVDSTNVGCEYRMSNRIGYELVTGFEVIDETRFAVDFASFFPGWRGLYSEVYAEHAFGADAFEVNANLQQWRSGADVLPSSGPLVFEGWVRGRSIDLRRNDGYHGSVSPDAVNPGLAQIGGVHVAFVADPVAQAALISEGDADLVMTDTSGPWAELLASGVVAASPGPSAVYEHWGLNLLNPHLTKPEVREAIAYAVDKEELVSSVFTGLLGPGIPAAGLGNVYWMPGQAAYVDHQQKYAGNNVDGAASVLRSAGYVLGSDGIWSHPVDGRLSLRAGTTGGNVLRDESLFVGSNQLARAGIEIVIDSAPGGLFYTEGPFAPEALAASASEGREGDPTRWDIAQFSLVSGPWPGLVTGFFLSGSNSNPYGFTNPAFDVEAAECDGVTDDLERDRCYNLLDEYVTTLDRGDDGLFIIPLAPRPHFYAYASAGVASAAVAPNHRGGGPLVNVGDFSLVG